ncbi:MAG: hypothetical protein ACO2XZ_05230 [Rickettsiales bacterium]
MGIGVTLGQLVPLDHKGFGVRCNLSDLLRRQGIIVSKIHKKPQNQIKITKILKI